MQTTNEPYISYNIQKVIELTTHPWINIQAIKEYFMLELDAASFHRGNLSIYSDGRIDWKKKQIKKKKNRKARAVLSTRCKDGTN